MPRKAGVDVDGDKLGQCWPFRGFGANGGDETVGVGLIRRGVLLSDEGSGVIITGLVDGVVELFERVGVVRVVKDEVGDVELHMDGFGTILGELEHAGVENEAAIEEFSEGC